MVNKFSILGVVALLSSVVMYQVGSTNGHLTELKDFFLAPVPLGVMLLLVGNKKRK